MAGRPQRCRRRRSTERGYAMVALLVGMSIMAVALSVALPAWSTVAKREREAELIFRGQQYARAIALFQRKNANVFPPSWDVLVQGRFLRKKYKDPMTPDGEFQPVYAGQVLPGQPGQANQPGEPGQAARAGGGVNQPRAGQSGLTGTPGLGSEPGRGAAGRMPLDPLAPQTQRGGVTGGGAGSLAGATPGLMGVVSKSTATSLREYNGRTKYNEWVFVATQASTSAGAGARGGRAGQPANAPGRGSPGQGGRAAPGGPPMSSPFSTAPGPGVVRP